MTDEKAEWLDQGTRHWKARAERAERRLDNIAVCLSSENLMILDDDDGHPYIEVQATDD